jgi:uncharacterized lipoprotein YmbA
MIKGLLIGICLFLASCSTSNVKQVNYYLLNGTNSVNHSAVVTQQSIKVVVQKIRLAEYLTQSNLAMQINDHQLHYSRQHAWAEPLDNAISKALLTDLNEQQSDIVFLNKDDPLALEHQYELVLQFDHLIATDKSTVITSGTYWLVSMNENKVTNHQKRFSLEKRLTENGYLHSVSQLRMLLSELSSQIYIDISGINEQS